MLKVDNTKGSTFDSCPRKYELSYIRNISPLKGSTALRYGIVWHSAMEAFYTHIWQHGWTRDGKAMEVAVRAIQEEWSRQTDNEYGMEYFEDYRTLENCIKSLVVYMDRFANDEGFIRVLEPERVFQIKIEVHNSEERKLFPRLDPFWFTGRRDLEVELNGRPWLWEHKTTGQPLSVQSKRLQRNPQFLGYTYAAQRTLRHMPEGAMIVLHHLSAYKSRTTGLYGKPKIEFDRIPQIYTSQDLYSWRHHMMRTAQGIQDGLRNDFFPMNMNSCYQYGSCVYTYICDQNRGRGLENLDLYYIREPWDVTTEVPEDKIIIVED